MFGITECLVDSLILFFGDANLDDSPLLLMSLFFDDDDDDDDDGGGDGEFCSLCCARGEPFVDDETNNMERKSTVYLALKDSYILSPRGTDSTE